MGISRLRKSGLFPIEAFAVISEASMIPLCEKYDVRWYMYKNDPLGEKKNVGLERAYKLDWDYMIELGSDDVLKTELLTAYTPHFGHKDVIGIGDFIMINTEDGACRRITERASAYGIGRAISRKVFDKVGTAIWPWSANSLLDNRSTFFLNRHGFMDTRLVNGPYAIDLKSAENIWPFNYLRGSEYDFDEAMKGLSAGEVDAINDLIHVEV